MQDVSRHAGAAQRLPARRWALRGLCAGAVWLSIIAAGALLGLVWPVHVPMNTLWSSSSGKPAPAYFSYLMFPHDEAVPLRTAEGVPTPRRLDRAVLNTEEEIASLVLIPVRQDGSGPEYVARTDLTLDREPVARTRLVSAWVAALAARKPSLRAATATFEPTSSGIQAVVHVADADEQWEYRYTIAGSRPSPDEMRYANRMNAAEASFELLFNALIAATILGSAPATWIILRRPSRL